MVVVKVVVLVDDVDVVDEVVDDEVVVGVVVLVVDNVVDEVDTPLGHHPIAEIQSPSQQFWSNPVPHSCMQPALPHPPSHHSHPPATHSPQFDWLPQTIVDEVVDVVDVEVEDVDDVVNEVVEGVDDVVVVDVVVVDEDVVAG